MVPRCSRPQISGVSASQTLSNINWMRSFWTCADLGVLDRPHLVPQRFLPLGAASAGTHCSCDGNSFWLKLCPVHVEQQPAENKFTGMRRVCEKRGTDLVSAMSRLG